MLHTMTCAELPVRLDCFYLIWDEQHKNRSSTLEKIVAELKFAETNVSKDFQS